jgi:membrane protease YdiL (CAAX protease family)
MQLLATGMAALEIPNLTSRLVIEALFAGYVALLLTRLAWWREAGFTRPEVPRRSLATLPLFLLPLIVLAASGIKPAAGDRVIEFVLFTVMVGFAEEGLLRGVVLRALLPTGPGRAVLVSSLIFGLGHLANIVTGASVSMTAVQVVENVFLGIAFAGACVYAGTIWPVVVLHALLDLVDVAGRGFAFPPPQPTAAPVLVPIVLTVLCALFGWWLLRRATRLSVALS